MRLRRVYRNVASAILVNSFLFFLMVTSTSTSAWGGTAFSVLYNFDTGGPLTCTGTAPSIICTDTNKWFGWTYDASTYGFKQDSDNNYRLYQDQYDGTNGWLEIDNTKGAAGTPGSLKGRVTGCTDASSCSPVCGGNIRTKADERNYLSRVCTSTLNAQPYIDLINPTGKHHAEFVGKDRITMYVYVPTFWTYRTSYGGPADDNFHIGTYVCRQSDEPCIDRTGCSPYSWGEPCNGDNGHFYHHYTIAPFGGGGWTKIVIDQNPQMHRNGNNPPYNPTGSWSGNDSDFTPFGENYIASLTRLYFDGKAENGIPSSSGAYHFWIDEVQAESKDLYYAERNQNETSIASVAVGYFPDGLGHWDISFCTETPNFGTYQIKYSATEFTNANFSTNGTYITPLTSVVTNPSAQGMIGKWRNEQYSYTRYATKFTLPSQYQVAGTTVYFAIKDVSQTASHGCSENGWNTDTRTSSNSNIYSVSYKVAGATAASSPPAAPRNLRIE